MRLTNLLVIGDVEEMIMEIKALCSGSNLVVHRHIIKVSRLGCPDIIFYINIFVLAAQPPSQEGSIATDSVHMSFGASVSAHCKSLRPFVQLPSQVTRLD
jgi:hypothetical protein